MRKCVSYSGVSFKECISFHPSSPDRACLASFNCSSHRGSTVGFCPLLGAAPGADTVTAWHCLPFHVSSPSKQDSKDLSRSSASIDNRRPYCLVCLNPPWGQYPDESTVTKENLFFSCWQVIKQQLADDRIAFLTSKPKDHVLLSQIPTVPNTWPQKPGVLEKFSNVEDVTMYIITNQEPRGVSCSQNGISHSASLFA